MSRSKLTKRNTKRIMKGGRCKKTMKRKNKLRKKQKGGLGLFGNKSASKKSRGLTAATTMAPPDRC